MHLIEQFVQKAYIQLFSWLSNIFINSIYNRICSFIYLLFQLIFLTVLYYVLAASGSCYLPVAFISSLTPTFSGTNSLITHLYSTVESAISGVFVATLKLALFYGLYTSLTHIIFGLDLVIIPSGELFYLVHFVLSTCKIIYWRLPVR